MRPSRTPFAIAAAFAVTILSACEPTEDGLLPYPDTEAGSSGIMVDGPWAPAASPRLRSLTTDGFTMRVSYECGWGTNELFKSTSGGSYLRAAGLSCSSPVNQYVDYNVTSSGVRYCYRVRSTSGSTVRWTNPSCRHSRYTATSLSTSESAARTLYTQFNWRRTDALDAYADANQTTPTLWYAMVFISAPYQEDALRSLGAHVQSTPVFPTELDYAHRTVVTQNDQPIGSWRFAVIPGPVYNSLRTQMIRDLDAGRRPGFPAIVFRRIPITAARFVANDMSRLRPEYLGQQGFEFNATRRCRIWNGVEVCEMQQEIVAWLTRKALYYLVEGVEAIIEGVQRAIARGSRVVNGEMTLSLRFDILNTDPAFDLGDNTVIQSAWRNGARIVPRGARVLIRQGLATFTGTLDSDGRLQIRIARGQATKVCLEMKNDAAMLTEFLGDVVVCVADLGTYGSGTTSAFQTVRVRNDYVNLLTQLTDAYDYVREILGHTMDRVTVLVGNTADQVALAGRSFAPCMGRSPNYFMSGGLSALGVIFPPTLLASSAAEFLFGVDIVVVSEDAPKRGIGVHEYGHFVMCDMMAKESEVAFQSAWTQIIFASADQSADRAESYMAEGFADFIASQVAGGTDYFGVSGSAPLSGVNWCDPVSGIGMDENIHQQTISPGFHSQVGRITTLFHDVFDGHRTWDDPNDGCAFGYAGPGQLTFLWGMQNREADDEGIALPGTAVGEVFARWVDDGARWTEGGFLGALADVVENHGHERASVCELFALHEESGECPFYVLPDIPADGGGSEAPYVP